MSSYLNWHGKENTWITTFFPSQCLKKVGIISWWWLTKEEASLENIERFVDQHDITFFYSDEVLYCYGRHGFDYNYDQLFSMLNKKNVYYIMFDEDFSARTQPDSTKLFCAPWFLKNALHISNDLTIDIDYRPKQYTFNMLLGSVRPYRSLLYKVLSNNPKVYSTYYGHPEYKNNFQNELDETDIKNSLENSKIVDTRIQTMIDMYRSDKHYILSHIVPTQIYNNSHFDVVCETFIKDNHQFVCEKTAKPLATGRFFCWHASPKVKLWLSKFGFSLESYHNSYDLALDNMTRLDVMIDDIISISKDEEMVKLIYKNSKQERVHNMEVYRKNFDNFSSKISDWILDKLN